MESGGDDGVNSGVNVNGASDNGAFEQVATEKVKMERTKTCGSGRENVRKRNRARKDMGEVKKGKRGRGEEREAGERRRKGTGGGKERDWGEEKKGNGER